MSYIRFKDEKRYDMLSLAHHQKRRKELIETNYTKLFEFQIINHLR